MVSSDIENASQNVLSLLFFVHYCVMVIALGIGYPYYLLGVVSLVGIGVMIIALLLIMVSMAGWN